MTKKNQHDFDEVMEKARNKINDAIEQDGPYTHNIISLSLSSVASKLGNKDANSLIDEFDLDSLYGFKKVEGK